MKELVIKLLIKCKLARLAYRIDPIITSVVLFPEVTDNIRKTFNQIGESLLPALQNAVDSMKELTDQIDKYMSEN